MLDGIPRADADPASRRGIEVLERGGQRVDGRDELLVWQGLARPGDRDRRGVSRRSAMEMLDNQRYRSRRIRS